MRKKTSRIWNISVEELKEKINKSSSIGEVLKKMGYNPKSAGSYKQLKERIDKENIDLSMLEKKRKEEQIKQIKKMTKKIPIEEVLTENSNFARMHLKRRLIEENILEYKCSECGQLPEWNGKPLSLQLDHINGINNDNRIQNLRILCPHCHSQTVTFCSKNKNKNKYKNT